MRIIKRFFIRVVSFLVVLIIIIGFTAVWISSHVQNKEKDNILCTITESKNEPSSSELESLNKFNADSILILGAGIKDQETPGYILKDRLDVGIMLYKSGLAPKILLSGDNGTVEHNEIHVMLKYVKDSGVPEEDIFCDHAGFSTYDSMYRAQSVFKVKKTIVVTQSYHEYRALYIGEKLGISVIGVAADQKKYSGQASRELREVLARDKDFFKVITKPEAEYVGDAIPINGSGIKSQGE